MPITLQNPLDDLIQAALAAYPDMDCVVRFGSLDGDGLAVTIWPDDGGRPEITIRPDVPLEGVLELLAHEIAHVAAGLEAGHGEAWKSAFAAIHAAYENRVAPEHEQQ